ncbi:unnamed protein product [Medioppia subpectinata]|uniref:Carboxylic ester hydrolase n=1 Tax=Medioppia subpectinata TaxID=1979941 RepID=A0A7R9KCW0_9ACAR|nr:unnamed protein product [Medioppia subpectinata]CAG2100776.1 unnamed protein product [Medioppia subpectinata]
MIANTIIKTTSGTVRGRVVSALNTTLYQFQGIPYAEPPIGALSCMQMEVPFYPSPVRQSEDSLVLNIWTPTIIDTTDNTTNQSLKPVMFWIYGGGNSFGNIDQFNGSALAAHDMVFVAPNYRVGQFGFLYGDREDAPGNVGLWDQLLALKWVRENIHLFGGDRDQITIFGQSSGSWSVSAHILSPLSKGLFKRAIMQSGAVVYHRDRDLNSKDSALAESKSIAKQLGCSERVDWIQYLRTVDAKQLVTSSRHLMFPVFGTEFLPLPAQTAIRDYKFNSGIDLLTGISSTEGSNLTRWFLAPDKPVWTLDDFVKYVKASDALFHGIDVQKVMDYYLKGVDTSSTPALKRAFYEYFGDLFMKYPTYLFAKLLASRVRNRHNIYFYELTHQNQLFAINLLCSEPESGIGHCMDIPFVFGKSIVGPNVKSYDETDRQFSRDVIRMWTNFAKYG